MRFLVAALLLSACTQDGTGVKLTIDPATYNPDAYLIVASYTTNVVTKSVSAVEKPLTFIARLPNQSTTVTFDVTAMTGQTALAHVTSATIDVPAHTVVPLNVAFSVPVVEDMTVGDLATAGAEWTLQRGTPPPGPGAIRGLWASSGADAYAVSTNTGGGNLFHTTDHGAHWTAQLAAGMATNLNAVSGTSASDVILVGDNALILRGANMSWTQENAPVAAGTRLNGVWALGGGDAYAVGSNNSVLHYAGGGWVLQTTVGTVEFHGVWGVPGNIWAVGSGGTILHSTGTATWSPQTSGTGAELRAVFGTGATDVWIVGDGVVLHSTNGTSWAPAAEGVPTDVSFRALGGRPGGPVWAAGSGFSVFRRDASTWVRELTGLPVDDTAGDRLNALYAPSATEVYAGGDGQILLHRP